MRLDFQNLWTVMNIEKYYEKVTIGHPQGDPIVFIHGSYATTSTWKKMVAHIAEYYPCILIKLPGHCGLPDPSDMERPSINTETDLIQEVVSKETETAVHLVGHSYGGVVALELALQSNIKLRHLTLFEPVATWVLDVVMDTTMSGKVSDFLNEYRPAVDKNEPHACARVIDFWAGEQTFEHWPAHIQDAMGPLTQNNIRHWDLCTTARFGLNDIKNINVPATVVHGSESNDVAHAIVDHLQKHLPYSNRYIIDGASHGMVATHSKQCLKIFADRPMLRLKRS